MSCLIPQKSEFKDQLGRKEAWTVYKRIAVFFFMFIFIFSSLVLAQTRRVKLTVKGKDAKPVEGVKITLTSPEKDDFKKVVITDSKGEAKLLIHMQIKNVHFLLEKEEYQNLQDSVALKQIRRSQQALYYERSFTIYRTDELTPKQQRQQFQVTQDAFSFFQIGTELFQAEDFLGAAEQFKKAVEIKPDFLEACQNLAAAYFRAELFDQAIEAAKKALEINPDSAKTLKLISVSYSKLGDEKAALEYHHKLQEHPDAQFSAEEVFNIGAAAANESRDEEAAEYFKKATEMKPEFVLAHYHLGVTCFRLKKMREAKAALEKYLELKPEGENAKAAKTLLEYIDKTQ